MKGKQLYLTGLQEAEAQQNKPREIRLRLDTFILSSVVIVLLFALAFSLGFERGKSAAFAAAGKPAVEAATAVTLPAAVSQIPQPLAAPEQTPPQVVEPQHQEKPKQDKAKPEITDTASAEPAKEGYKIQIASYKQPDAAKRETQRLLDKGYKAYQNRSGNYTAVYVGGYNSITAAKDALQQLRAQYKDCLIKKL